MTSDEYEMILEITRTTAAMHRRMAEDHDSAAQDAAERERAALFVQSYLQPAAPPRVTTSAVPLGPAMYLTMAYLPLRWHQYLPGILIVAMARFDVRVIRWGRWWRSTALYRATRSPMLRAWNWLVPDLMGDEPCSLECVGMDRNCRFAPPGAPQECHRRRHASPLWVALLVAAWLIVVALVGVCMGTWTSVVLP